MQKLFVLVLALTSILLLPAPASAQRLYRLDAVGGPHSPAKFLGASDCPLGDTITVRSPGFSKGVSRARVEANGVFHLSATIKPQAVKKRFIEIKSARCTSFSQDLRRDFGPKVSLVVPQGFVLPFTGVRLGHWLALGLSLLLAGVLLVRLSSRPSGRGAPSSRR